MKSDNVHVVTGAFGFSGKYIAKRLLDSGHHVRTITNSPHRANPFGGKVEVHTFNFDHADKLVDSLRGASVLYNTYWVRFNFKDFAYSNAVDNTLKLFDAAKKAGVRRIVHVSITNPSEDSPFEYFRGKARLERALTDSGISYAILRPAVLFGDEGILINNIAWFLRRFPVYGVFGSGDYRLQPIYVDDLAKLAVEQGHGTENCVIDSIGPETFTYRGMVQEIGRAIGCRRAIVSIPPTVGYCFGWIVGRTLGDVAITYDEIEGLMANLLCTNSAPAGDTKLTEWVCDHSSSLGVHYSSELARRRNRTEAYERL